MTLNHVGLYDEIVDNRHKLHYVNSVDYDNSAFGVDDQIDGIVIFQKQFILIDTN